MHLSVQYNHFNRAHWFVVRCEESGASKATPAVAEASGSYLLGKRERAPTSGENGERVFIYIYLYGTARHASVLCVLSLMSD